jgi:hydrogenase-4 component E
VRPELFGVLVLLGFTVVAARRRSVGIALAAAQSMALGALAVADAVGAHGGSLALAVVILVARGLVLPGLLLLVVRGTREPGRVSSERAAGSRLVLAIAAVAVAVAFVPSFGLRGAGAEQAAVALLVLGLVIAATRQAVVFQALGFLVAENGVYLAGLSVPGGVPAALELALLFDLLVVLAVVAAFGARIHELFGSSDTTLLRDLRD